MSKLARTIPVVAIAATALMAVPAGAGAAVQIGQVAPAGGVTNCFGATLFLNSQVAPGSPSYAVPPGGGVLTQWSARGGASDNSLKLKVVNPTAPMTYRIVATDLQQPVFANLLNTYPIRIPVSGEELLALWLSSPGGAHPACYNGAPGDIREFRLGNSSEPNVGEDFVTNSTANGFRTNVAALLEPDCDKDGLGDETQDTNLSTCAGPGPGTGPVLGPGGTPVFCKGKPATIVGTAGSDVRTGSKGRDVIVGLAGNDTLSGVGGNDLICGGAGKDNLNGGKGKDKLYGQKGKDTLRGKAGNDLCVGGPSKDIAKKCEKTKSI